MVHTADIQDRDGAPDVLASIRAGFPWLRHIFADSNSVIFDWEDAEEMDEGRGDHWAEIQDDESLIGKIAFHNGDQSGFCVCRRPTSSTPC